MSAALARDEPDDLTLAEAYAARLVALARERSGASPAAAREAVAEEAGLAPGTIENLTRQRRKGVTGGVLARLRAVLIRELIAEMGRLQHEVDLARRAARAPQDDAVRAAEAALAEARTLLTGAARG